MSVMHPLTERRRKELSALVRRRGRDESGLFLVEGVRSVESAIGAGASLREIVVSDSACARPDVERLTASAGVPVFIGRDHDVDRIGDVQTGQGVVGVAEIRRMALDDLDRSGPIVVLDGVQDPGNVGTILRTAAWFGIRSIVSGPGTADWYSPKVVRATMGALWDLDLVQTQDLVVATRTWAREGRSLWVADMTGIEVADWVPATGDVLVLGSEAHGPSTAVREVAGGRVTIARGVAAGATAFGTESLNVSAAAAVLMHAWRSRPRA